MPITTKVNGAYVAPVAVFTKKAGVYAAAQAMGKVAGAYQSVLGPAGQIPVILLAPVINGTPQVNTPLSITAGQTSGATSTVRSIYSGGALVAGPAAGVGYTPVYADIGKAFSVTEVASNANGSTSNLSANSAACPVKTFTFIQELPVGFSTEKTLPIQSNRSSAIIKNIGPYSVTLFPSANLFYQTTRPATGGIVVPVGSESSIDDTAMYYAMTRRIVITALSFASGVATATAASHGLIVGDVISVAGGLDTATTSPYNTDYQPLAGSPKSPCTAPVLSVIDANTFTYTPGGTPTQVPTTMPNCGPICTVLIEGTVL